MHELACLESTLVKTTDCRTNTVHVSCYVYGVIILHLRTVLRAWVVLLLATGNLLQYVYCYKVATGAQTRGNFTFRSNQTWPNTTKSRANRATPNLCQFVPHLRMSLCTRGDGLACVTERFNAGIWILRWSDILIGNIGLPLQKLISACSTVLTLDPTVWDNCHQWILGNYSTPSRAGWL